MPFKNKEDRQKYDVERRRAGKAVSPRRLEQRKFLDSVKDVPCMDCRKKFPPECMDFDHVRGTKLFNVGAFVFCGISQARLVEEISKCDIVCANCHRIRTYKRRRESSRRVR